MARIFGEGAERDRKGAEGEEVTQAALRPLRRAGWRVLHDVEYAGEGNVDHLLIGPGGVIALDSKFTTERLWVTPKALGGSQGNHIGKAKIAARLAERALADPDLGVITVEPALIFWGPGAPDIPGGHIVIQQTLVLEGRRAREWRTTLCNRPIVLGEGNVSAITESVKRFAAVPAECRGRRNQRAAGATEGS